MSVRSVDLPTVDVVQFPRMPRPNWYARRTYDDGRTGHGEPWLTRMAAVIAADITRKQTVYMSRRDGGIGDGDVCPLFPDHGNMFVLKGTDPPQQWCPHSGHLNKPGSEIPPSRSKWPLHGFEDSVGTYLARLDRAISQAALPDLSDVEVR